MAPRAASAAPAAPRLPIRMLFDRVLVSVDSEKGERTSGGGILIPATASVGKRLSWAVVVATGGNVRQVQPGDRVLFDPEDRHEVELQSKGYILLREKDIHAVAASRVDDGNTGLYL
ncbi:MAG: co-chaperone GroES [Dermatophilaceae bacterium]|nr:co-chaperone GroES [Dermatophilaceae bacterium]